MGYYYEALLCVGRSNSGNKKNFLTKYSCSSNRFAKLVFEKHSCL